MKKIFYCLILVLAFSSISFGRTKVSDYVRKGGKNVKTSTTISYKLMETYPGATVTVYKKGTLTLATIYADEAGTPKANPFIAASDASYSFYIDLKRYDIKFSGTGIATPFTLSDKFVNDSADLFDVTAFGAKCDNSTNDVIAISNATTAAALVDGSIIIPRGTCRTQSITFPTNVELEMKHGAILYPITTNTITIVGNFNADNSQHFANATVGLGTIAFTGNNKLKDYQIGWWGAKGDNSTDDTASLNAAFASQPSGTTMHLSPHANYKHTGILMVDHKFSVTIVGSDVESPIVDSGNLPRFIYVGTDGGTAIHTLNAYTCTFRGFATIAANGGTTGAATNFHMDQDGSGPAPISTGNIFKAIYFYANNTRADSIGLNINNISGTNNEQHQISQCRFFGYSQNFGQRLGSGIYLGHANVKQIHIDYTAFIGLAKGIDVGGGSFRSLNNNMVSTDIMYYGSMTDAIYIFGDDSEDCTQIIQHGPVGSPAAVTIIAGRYQDLHGAGTPSLTRSNDPILAWQHLQVSGTIFTARDPDGFNENFITGNPGGGILLWGMGNVVTNTSALNLKIGFATFQRTISLNADNEFGLLLSGSQYNQNSLQGLTTTETVRNIAGIQQLNSEPVVPAATDSIVFGDSAQIEISGLAVPNKPTVSFIGTNDQGLNLNSLILIARDAAGNETIGSIYNQGVLANSILSVPNHVHVEWPKVPNAIDYLLLQVNGSGARIIDTITPSGTNIESYDIITNPVSAYTYVLPTYNKTSRIKLRGPIAPDATTFANLGIPSPANGDIKYCSDCTIANPCAGSGTGAIAKRLNGVWICN